MSVEAVAHVLRGGLDGRCIEVQGDGHYIGRHGVFAVLIVLAEHADAYGRGACPSQRTIALETGLDRRQVQHAVKQLAADHIITATAAAIPRRRGATYTVHLGSGTTAQSEESEPQLGGGSTAQSEHNSAVHSAVHSAVIAPHKPEPEQYLHRRDSYASPDEDNPDRKLSLEQIRDIRTAKLTEGRHQLDDERQTAKAKRTRPTAVA